MKTKRSKIGRPAKSKAMRHIEALIREAERLSLMADKTLRGSGTAARRKATPAKDPASRKRRRTGERRGS